RHSRCGNLSAAAGAGDSPGTTLVRAATWTLLSRINYELEAGQQRSGIGVAVLKINDPPLGAVTAMDPEGRPVRIAADLEHSVLIDARDLEVELDVANEVLFRIVTKNLGDQQRADLVPADLLEGQVEGEVLVSRQVRFGGGDPGNIGDKNACF